MINALLAIIPVSILFFWFQSMGNKHEVMDNLGEHEKKISS